MYSLFIKASRLCTWNTPVHNKIISLCSEKKVFFRIITEVIKKIVKLGTQLYIDILLSEQFFTHFGVVTQSILKPADAITKKSAKLV